MLEIPLNRRSEIPLYRQLARHLEMMIQSGSLPAWERLPGSRSLAQDLSVSRMTVTEAYRCLEDRGYVTQKGRSGVYVTGFWDLEPKSQLDLELPKWAMDGERPSSSLIPCRELSRLAKESLAKGADLLKSCPLPGFSELRRSLVSHSAARGIPAQWQDVAVTSGGRQGISLSFKALRDMGVKSVFMDELNYPYAWRAALSEGLSVFPYRSEKELLRLASQASSLQALYLVPSFSNPTGLTMGRPVREKLLKLSHEKKLWIVEDDSYGELRYSSESVPALRAMDSGEFLIYLGSFSQALFPAMRLGYALTPPGAREFFLKALDERGGPVSSLVQAVVQGFIVSGGLEASLERVRMTMAVRMKTLCLELSLRSQNRWSFLEPKGGIYLWLSTPGLDGDEASELAFEKGVSVSPGREFSLSGRPVDAVRLSVSEIDVSSIPLAVKRLSEAWSDALSR